MSFRSACGVTALVLVLVPLSAAAKPPPHQVTAFNRDFGRFVDQLRATPHAPPGFVVVAFHEGDTVFEKAYGTRNIATGAPMTLDTPVYNASLTKAYTGLLAAMLHREGRLPLQTRLTDIWPEVSFPKPLSASDVTAAKLLSHSSGVYNGTLLYRVNTTGELTLKQVPELLSAHTVVAPDFQYSNFGPVTYSMMAHARTGESWHAALRNRIFKPLGLTRTMSRIEDIPAGEAAHCHVTRGGKTMPVPLKPTAVLNAAGGIYATARDTAKFLKLFTTDGRSARGKVDAETLRLTWQPQTVQKVNFAGLQRDGYGLGWDLGSEDGRRYVSRSGGYYGCRSYAVWMPEAKFGVAVLSVGEVAVNGMNVGMIKQAIDLWTGNPDARARGLARIAAFHTSAAAETAKLQGIDPRLINPAPVDSRTAAAALGSYRHPRLGNARVSLDGNRLVFTSGALQGHLIPTGKGEFLFYNLASHDTERLTFSGDPGAPFESLLLDDDRFERVE